MQSVKPQSLLAGVSQARWRACHRVVPRPQRSQRSSSPPRQSIYETVRQIELPAGDCRYCGCVATCSNEGSNGSVVYSRQRITQVESSLRRSDGVVATPTTCSWHTTGAHLWFAACCHRPARHRVCGHATGFHRSCPGGCTTHHHQVSSGSSRDSSRPSLNHELICRHPELHQEHAGMASWPQPPQPTSQHEHVPAGQPNCTLIN